MIEVEGYVLKSWHKNQCVSLCMYVGDSSLCFVTFAGLSTPSLLHSSPASIHSLYEKTRVCLTRVCLQVPRVLCRLWKLGENRKCLAWLLIERIHSRCMNVIGGLANSQVQNKVSEKGVRMWRQIMTTHISVGVVNYRGSQSKKLAHKSRTTCLYRSIPTGSAHAYLVISLSNFGCNTFWNCQIYSCTTHVG